MNNFLTTNNMEEDTKTTKKTTNGLLTDIKIFGILLLSTLAIGIGLNFLWPDSLPWNHVPRTVRFAPILDKLPIITTDELRALIRENPSIVILDARCESAYRKGHIPGAINLDPGAIEKQYPPLVEKLLNADKIVVYCADVHCDMSDELAIHLYERGHLKIQRYKEGWKGWKGANKIKD